MSNFDIEEFLVHPDLGIQELSKVFPLNKKNYSSLPQDLRMFCETYDFSKSSWEIAYHESRAYQTNSFEMYQRLSNAYHNSLLVDFPILEILLAEACIVLSDLFEAREILDGLCSRWPETDLKNILDRVNLCIEYLQKDDDEHFNSRDFKMLSEEHGEEISEVITYNQPKELSPEAIFDSQHDDLLIQWNNVQTHEAEAIELFIRMTCIDTNIIEGVFEFEGQTWSRLIRKGFYEHSIEGFSKQSKIKKKSQVMRILNNTAGCMQLITPILNNFSLFSTSFIINLHKELLKDDNFEFYEIEDYNFPGSIYTSYCLIPIGCYRKVSICTRHKSSIVQFCHKHNIETHMEQFVEQAIKLLSSPSIDPFLKCAWLQWAFLRIHPFADGNGRMSRILSSIPLLQVNLPPVVVSSKNGVKQCYFDALQTADEEGNLLPLAEFLRNQTLNGMELIKNLPSADTLGSNPYSGNVNLTRRRSLRSSNLQLPSPGEGTR